ncbi:MAG: hypothetical protein KF685_08705 [Acidobacteria bacterium]|nr:hypothetical protein [Acidobacteriota bacterium]
MKVLSMTFFMLVAVFAVKAQMAGGAAGAAGYSKAYEAAGGSAASKQVQQKMGSVLKGAVNRSVTAKPRSAPAARSSRGRQTARPANRPQTTATTTYRPDPSIDVAHTLAYSIGTNDQEKELLHALFVTTKNAFDVEVAKKGRSNNVSAAFTFFIVSSSMVYHGSPEPSDKAVDALWDALDESLQELPEFAQMSDRDKQMLSDTLVSLSGLMILGHPQYNPSLDKQTQEAYREIAGTMIRTVLQTDPEKLRFGKDGLIVD